MDSECKTLLQKQNGDITETTSMCSTAFVEHIHTGFTLSYRSGLSLNKSTLVVNLQFKGPKLDKTLS